MKRSRTEHPLKKTNHKPWQLERAWEAFMKDNLIDNVKEAQPPSFDQRVDGSRTEALAKTDISEIHTNPQKESTMANKSSGATRKKASPSVSSSVKYGVTPKSSPGAGHTPAGSDYSKDEWKQIITEWIALESVPREKGAPTLTEERNAMAAHYQRNYMTILKHGRALGMIGEGIPRKPKKSTTQKRATKESADKELTVTRTTRRGRPPKTVESPTLESTPEAPAAKNIQIDSSSGMDDKNMRELITLRKVVDGAVASGKLKPHDIVELLS